MFKNSTKLHDLIVIGGGPAGMMAAGTAANRGLEVLLLEKNPSLGKKLLITGGGRCNLTNNKPDNKTMLAKYKGNGKFLAAAFVQFSVDDTLNFFNYRGMQTKEEAEGRVFPTSDQAQSVWDVLLDYLKEGNVTIRTNAPVSKISLDKITRQFILELKNREKIICKKCIIATGGTSRPETGSTGDGFEWLARLGHTIVKNNFALVPLALKDEWAKKLGGVTLRDIKLTVLQNGKKEISQIGKILFTHFGVSGPTILNMSKTIGELLQYGKVMIELDLFPTDDIAELKKKFQNLLSVESNKKLKNTLGQLIPSSLVSTLLELSKIDGETFNHSLVREDRAKLISLVKAIPMNVDRLLGANKAVISSGGVALEEINFKTMGSKLIPNLYLVGDVLNIDRPSGGYSLQLCWTTGFVAGSSC